MFDFHNLTLHKVCSQFVIHERNNGNVEPRRILITFRNAFFAFSQLSVKFLVKVFIMCGN